MHEKCLDILTYKKFFRLNKKEVLVGYKYLNTRSCWMKNQKHTRTFLFFSRVIFGIVGIFVRNIQLFSGVLRFIGPF